MRPMGIPERRIAVIGAGACGAELREMAYQLGRELAGRAVIVCGGGGGVMAAVAEGARSAGGLTVGILPGADPRQSRPAAAVDVALFSGLGQARNQVVVLSGEAVVAVGGGWGTLNEIGLALKHGRTVVRLASWRLERPDGRAEPLLRDADSPAEAARIALEAAAREHP